MPPSAADLRTVPLFHGFSDDEIAAVAARFEPVPATAHPVLFDVGQPATELYLLTAGEVVLDHPGDDRFRIAPPALIGELGALTGLPRSTRASITPGATVWSLAARALQDHLRASQELGVRFLANLLGAVAAKVHRDQRRTANMRQHLIATQKELKRLREVVLETEETPLSRQVHDTLDRLIAHNRRVNYQIEPPPALPAALRLDAGSVRVLALSRTHLTLLATPAEGTWITGVLELPGAELPVSGRVTRLAGDRASVELDLLIDEYAAVYESYLTRVQLLDILV
jgi:CRP-like cAMP-binding protein